MTLAQVEGSEDPVSANENPPPASTRWPHITRFLANAGHITVGCVAPIDGAAIAADEHKLYVTLVRKPDEPLDDLMQRLDLALGKALNEGIHTNEVEGGRFMVPRMK
jgi:hypothetical protein